MMALAYLSYRIKETWADLGDWQPLVAYVAAMVITIVTVVGTMPAEATEVPKDEVEKMEKMNTHSVVILKGSLMCMNYTAITSITDMYTSHGRERAKALEVVLTEAGICLRSPSKMLVAAGPPLRRHCIAKRNVCVGVHAMSAIGGIKMFVIGVEVVKEA